MLWDASTIRLDSCEVLWGGGGGGGRESFRPLLTNARSEFDGISSAGADGMETTRPIMERGNNNDRHAPEFRCLSVGFVTLCYTWLNLCCSCLVCIVSFVGQQLSQC